MWWDGEPLRHGFEGSFEWKMPLHPRRNCTAGPGGVCLKNTSPLHHTLPTFEHVGTPGAANFQSIRNIFLAARHLGYAFRPPEGGQQEEERALQTGGSSLARHLQGSVWPNPSSISAACLGQPCSFTNSTIFSDYFSGHIPSFPLVFQRAGYRPYKDLPQKAGLFWWHLDFYLDDLLGLFIVDYGPQ